LSFDALFGIELLALSDNAILFTLTPGNDYFVSIHVAKIRSDTTNTQTNGLTDLFIKSLYLFRNFCYN